MDQAGKVPCPDVVLVVNVGDREAIIRKDEFGVIVKVEL